MDTECIPDQLEFHGPGRRQIVGRFDGGRLTCDGGGLLLREVDQRIGLLDRVGECFRDYRVQESVEHPVRDLVAQRWSGEIGQSRKWTNCSTIGLYGRSRGTGHPGLVFFNRGAEPLVFDPLHRSDRKKNAHMLILGPTGKGANKC